MKIILIIAVIIIINITINIVIILVADDNNNQDRVTYYMYIIFTEYLNGGLTVFQPNITKQWEGDIFIATANQTNITALIYDPNDWLKMRTEKASFFWIINNNSSVDVSMALFFFSFYAYIFIKYFGVSI